MPIALHVSSRAAGGNFTPSSTPGMLYYWLSDDQTIATDTEYSGVGNGNLTFSGTMVTATTTGSPFVGTGGAQDSRWENSWIQITGQPTPANNGTFRLTNWIGANQVQWRNAAGVAEPFVGNWHLWGKCDRITERYASKLFTAFSGGTMTGWWNYTQSDKGMPNGIQTVNITETSLTRRAMVLDDATLAGNLNGSTNFTLGGYYYMPNGWPATTNAAYQSFAAASGFTPGAYIRLRTSASQGMSLLVRNTGSDTDTLTRILTPPTTGFQLFCVTYDYPTRTAEYFIDGVSQGTVTDTLGVAPVPASLQFVMLGEEAQATTEREIWCRGQFATLGKKSTSEQLQLKAWYENPTPL